MPSPRPQFLRSFFHWPMSPLDPASTPVPSSALRASWFSGFRAMVTSMVNTDIFSRLFPLRGEAGEPVPSSLEAALWKDAPVAFPTSGCPREHHFELARALGLLKCPLGIWDCQGPVFSAQACLRGSVCQREWLAHLNSQRHSRTVPLSATSVGIWASAVNSNQPGRQKNTEG